MSKDIHTRPPIQRMAIIAKYLREGKPFTAAAIASRFEIDARTLRRDIEFMRDRLCYDFCWDPRACTYVLLSAPEAVL